MSKRKAAEYQVQAGKGFPALRKSSQDADPSVQGLYIGVMLVNKYLSIYKYNSRVCLSMSPDQTCLPQVSTVTPATGRIQTSKNLTWENRNSDAEANHLPVTPGAFLAKHKHEKNNPARESEPNCHSAVPQEQQGSAISTYQTLLLQVISTVETNLQVIEG